jgi:hypothetical protein
LVAAAAAGNFFAAASSSRIRFFLGVVRLLLLDHAGELLLHRVEVDVRPAAPLTFFCSCGGANESNVVNIGNFTRFGPEADLRRPDPALAARHLRQRVEHLLA